VQERPLTLLERALFIDALQVIESKDLPFIQDHRRIFPVHRLGLDVQQAKGQKDVVFIHARLPRSVDHLLFDEMEPMIADEELLFVREERLTIGAEHMIEDVHPRHGDSDPADVHVERTPTGSPTNAGPRAECSAATTNVSVAAKPIPALRKEIAALVPPPPPVQPPATQPVAPPAPTAAPVIQAHAEAMRTLQP